MNWDKSSRGTVASDTAITPYAPPLGLGEGYTAQYHMDHTRRNRTDGQVQGTVARVLHDAMATGNVRTDDTVEQWTPPNAPAEDLTTAGGSGYSTGEVAVTNIANVTGNARMYAVKLRRCTTLTPAT